MCRRCDVVTEFLRYAEAMGQPPTLKSIAEWHKTHSRRGGVDPMSFRAKP